MKRFLLFGYVNYYPSGGWNDFIAAYDTKEEALTELKRRLDIPQWTHDDWIYDGHVIDIETCTRFEIEEGR